MDGELVRAELPADTVELLEALAGRLNMTTGIYHLELAFKDGMFDVGWRKDRITRSSLAAHDAARGAFDAGE